MAKKKTAKKKTAVSKDAASKDATTTKVAKKTKKSASQPSLTNLRREIDKLDRSILEQVNARAQLANEIGKVKNKTGDAIYVPSREEDVLDRIEDRNKGPLSAQCVRAVFREIISGSRALEKVLRVAYLGPAYSYSHLAAIHQFGHCVELVPVRNIPVVFEEVHSGQSDYGLVPLENSTDGRIADTLDMFSRLPVRICSEVQLRIRHCLLGTGSRSMVREVYSRPQALSQCRKWLSMHLPAARAIEVTSTSTAAEMAREKPEAAAIASSQAGVHYGLNVLAQNIEDNPDNITRFAVIGDRAAPKSGDDKTSIMFQIPHKPGSLADAMSIFKRAKLNLTWIESFPTSGEQGGYLFFVEMEGHPSSVRIKRAIEMLRKKSIRLEILGCYAKSTPVD